MSHELLIGRIQNRLSRGWTTNLKSTVFPDGIRRLPRKSSYNGRKSSYNGKKSSFNFVTFGVPYARSIYRARHVSASITSCQCNWLSRQPCTRWACALDDVTSQLARAFYRVPEEGRGYKRPLPLHRPIDVKRSTARYVQDLVRNRFISLSCIFETRVFFILVTPQLRYHLIAWA